MHRCAMHSRADPVLERVDVKGHLAPAGDNVAGQFFSVGAIRRVKRYGG